MNVRRTRSGVMLRIVRIDSTVLKLVWIAFLPLHRKSTLSIVKRRATFMIKLTITVFIKTILTKELIGSK